MVMREVPSSALLEKDGETREVNWLSRGVGNPPRSGGTLDPSCAGATRPLRKRPKTYTVMVMESRTATQGSYIDVVHAATVLET